jgi:hypothetical protein
MPKAKDKGSEPKTSRITRYVCARCGVSAEPQFTLTLTWKDRRKDCLHFCKECGAPTMAELAVWRLTGKFPTKTQPTTEEATPDAGHQG